MENKQFEIKVAGIVQIFWVWNFPIFSGFQGNFPGEFSMNFLTIKTQNIRDTIHERPPLFKKIFRITKRNGIFLDEQTIPKNPKLNQ